MEVGVGVGVEVRCARVVMEVGVEVRCARVGLWWLLVLH